MVRHPVSYNLIRRTQTNASPRVVDSFKANRVEPRLKTLVLEFRFDRAKNTVPEIVFHGSRHRSEFELLKPATRRPTFSRGGKLDTKFLRNLSGENKQENARRVRDIHRVFLSFVENQTLLK
jgi:hypothetical protein